MGGWGVGAGALNKYQRSAPVTAGNLLKPSRAARMGRQHGLPAAQERRSPRQPWEEAGVPACRSSSGGACRALEGWHGPGWPPWVVVQLEDQHYKGSTGQVSHLAIQALPDLHHARPLQGQVLGRGEQPLDLQAGGQAWQVGSAGHMLRSRTRPSDRRQKAQAVRAGGCGRRQRGSELQPEGEVEPVPWLVTASQGVRAGWEPHRWPQQHGRVAREGARGWGGGGPTWRSTSAAISSFVLGM